MLMSQTVHLRAVSSSFSDPYLYRLHGLPQVPTSTQPSPEVTLRKPLGVLLTLLESTLTRVLASVDSKGLADMLNPLDATLTRNPGEGHSLASALLIPSICVALLVSPLAKAQEKSPPSHQVPESRCTNPPKTCASRSWKSRHCDLAPRASRPSPSKPMTPSNTSKSTASALLSPIPQRG